MSKQTITGIAAIGVASIILGAGMVMILQSDVAAHGDIIADKPVADVGEQITFYMVNIGTGQSMTTHFFIQFHDGTPTVELNNVFNITHQFPFEGTYTITLIAVSSYGLTDVSSTVVEIVNQQPAVDIVLPSGSVHEDDTISISVDPATNATYPDSDTDKTSLDYMWRFGDGSIMTGNNVTKAFNQSGLYPVDVYVADDQGAVGYASENITILNVAPVADYSWTGGGFIPEDVNILFDASLSSDTASDVESLRNFWDFGDGMHGRGKLVYHAFVSSGTFPVKLTVIDNDGEKDDMIKNIIVQNENPTSSTSTPSPALKEGDTGVYFANANDTFSDLNQMEYQWNLGGNGSTLTHLWDDNFVGGVSSIATDPDGATSTSTQAVSIANTNPNIMVDSISMLGNITLSMAGTPNNTLFMRILQDGHETSYTSLVKNASSTRPGQARAVLGMDFDLSREWEIEIFYGHLNQSTVTNVTGAPGLDDAYSNTTENYIIFGPHGDAHGANPAWLTFNFIDGLSFTLFNVFWVWCNESWVWSINPKDYLITSTLTVKGRVMDRGKDALNVTITYGDEVYTFTSNGTTG
nr:PKD domain-containing protein [Candidatus Sigynarchaeota archaeon]